MKILLVFAVCIASALSIMYECARICMERGMCCVDADKGYVCRPYGTEGSLCYTNYSDIDVLHNMYYITCPCAPEFMCPYNWREDYPRVRCVRYN